jgi:hypothetical protein
MEDDNKAEPMLGAEDRTQKECGVQNGQDKYASSFYGQSLTNWHNHTRFELKDLV